MHYTRIYVDDAGETHFEDVTIDTAPVDFAPPAPPLLMSEPVAAARCIFYRLPPGWVGDWHPAPRRQFRFVLSGEVEIEVSDGSVRRFGPGAIGLLDDVGSVGHVTRVVGTEDYVGAFVQL